ncbi:MAG: hypothetical protein WD030_08145 [Pirellulales bacterium]
MHQTIARSLTGLATLRVGGTLLAVLLAFLLARPVGAVEESAAFLDALRERQLFDYAELYLEKAKDNDLVDDEFKQSIPYELAATKVAAANASSNQGERETKLLEAVTDFQAFKKAQPKHPRANTVDLQIGNIYVMLGKTRVLQAERTSDATEKSQFRTEAQKFFADGLVAINQANADITAGLKELPEVIPPANRKLIQRREDLRREYLQTELLLAAVKRERALAFEAGSEDFTKAMTEASDAYEKLFVDHRRRLAGLFARLQQGRCLLDLKKPDDAMRCFYELIDQDESEEAVRNLKAQAVRYAMEASILLKEFNEATLLADQIQPRRGEGNTPDFIAIKFFKAKASKLLADSLDPAKNKAEVGKLTSQAKDLATDVSRVQGEFRSDAIKLLSELGKQVDDSPREPTNFAEALARATTARSGWLAAKADAAQKTGDEQTAALELANKSRDDAFGFYRMALTMADDETPQGSLNEVHYFMCYLYWDEQNYPNAAILGNYLARNFPEFSGSKSAATIAMASWLKMYSEAADKAFESEQVKEAARFMVKQWPNEPEAQDAYVTLVNFALVEGDSDTALDYLQQLPESSPKRGDLAIKLGQSLWSNYLKEVRKDEAAGRLSDEELTAMETRAREVLESGVTRAQSGGEVDRTVANAVLALAQLYADSSQPAAAIRWLEDDKVGALTLVNSDHAAAKHEPYAEETFKVALRSYVSVLPELAGEPAQAEATTKKAEAVMNQLEKTFGKGDAERLTRIYISMGKNLEDQMELLGGDTAKKVALGQAFQNFLSRIGERAEGNTFQSLTWVAETFYSLGQSFNTPDAPSGQAKSYFRKAADNYERILTRAAADSAWAPDDRSLMGIRMRLANCYREMGELDKATNSFVEILKPKQGNLTAQLDAAMVLQERGKTDPDFYRHAIGGFHDIPGKPGTHYIWGWSKIGKLTAGNAKFAKYFHQAALNGIVCRYELALTLSGDSKRELLDVAKRTLENQHRRFPEMGGDEWKPKYDSLLKNIQRALGEQPAGLKALEGNVASN